MAGLKSYLRRGLRLRGETCIVTAQIHEAMAYSSHGVFPRLGGQEVRVLAELEWMRAQGHWVALGAPSHSQIAKRAQAAGILFYPLRTHKARLPLEVLRLAAWLISNRVELVNTHSSNDGWLAGLAARLAMRPILIRSRHIEVDYPNRLSSGFAFRSLPHRVITTSRRIADRLVAELGVPAGRVTCVATGVDLTRFNPGIEGRCGRS